MKAGGKVFLKYFWFHNIFKKENVSSLLYMFREEIIPAGTIYLVNAGNKKYVYILLQW